MTRQKLDIQSLLHWLDNSPESVTFDEVIAVIDQHYNFTPVQFFNGELCNEAGQNTGSCKIFSFASLHNLSDQQTLHCFGDYYRIDVLHHPGEFNHQNIRNFMRTGWSGISFAANALTTKKAG